MAAKSITDGTRKIHTNNRYINQLTTSPPSYGEVCTDSLVASVNNPIIGNPPSYGELFTNGLAGTVNDPPPCYQPVNSSINTDIQLPGDQTPDINNSSNDEDEKYDKCCICMKRKAGIWRAGECRHLICIECLRKQPNFKYNMCLKCREPNYTGKPKPVASWSRYRLIHCYRCNCSESHFRHNGGGLCDLCGAWMKDHRMIHMDNGSHVCSCEFEDVE